MPQRPIWPAVSRKLGRSAGVTEAPARNRRCTASSADSIDTGSGASRSLPPADPKRRTRACRSAGETALAPANDPIALPRPKFSTAPKAAARFISVVSSAISGTTPGTVAGALPADTNRTGSRNTRASTLPCSSAPGPLIAASTAVISARAEADGSGAWSASVTKVASPAASRLRTVLTSEDCAAAASETARGLDSGSVVVLRGSGKVSKGVTPGSGLAASHPNGSAGKFPCIA